MQEVLLLLLVACLPLATWTGYRVGKKRLKRQTTHLPNQYFAGLNHLLNEQPDKAIDVFIEQLQQNSEVVDTHLTLGNLFRRRGEVDRAIRIHQNLIARPSLPADIRKLALLELAYDYHAAGLFDRAESLFTELLSEPQHKREALKNLIAVYQQLMDWPQAIEVAQKYAKITGTTQANRIAQYHCEIAQQAFDNGAKGEALEALQKAIKVQPTGLRQNLLLAKHHMGQSEYKRALKLFRDLSTWHAGYLSEFVQDMHRCHIQLGSEKRFHLDLRDYLLTSHNLDALMLYRNLSKATQSGDQLLEILEDFSLSSPSIQAIMHLVSSYRDHAKEPGRSQYDKLLRVLETMVDAENNYHCDACGYDSNTLFWQCPACKEWSTMVPKFQQTTQQ